MAARVLPAAVAFLVLLSGSVTSQDLVRLDDIDLEDTDPVASNPYGIAFHPTEPLAYVSLSGEPGFPADEFNGSTVVEIDMASFEVVREFTVDPFPTELRVSAGGDTLYVLCSTDGTLVAIDLDSDDGESETIELQDTGGDAVSFPSALEISPDGDELWVTSNGGSFDGSDENLLILDADTLDLLGTVEIAGGIGRIAVTTDDIVVVPVGFPGDDYTAAPEVRIYDAGDGTPWTELATLTLEMPTDGFPAPSDVVISADEETAYVSVFGGSAEIFVVDLVDNALNDPLEIENGTYVHQALALSPDGQWLFVAEFFDEDLAILDLATGDVVDRIDTGALPNAVEVRGGRLWVPNQEDETVTVVALPGSYLRGDVNDSGSLEIGDAVGLLLALFLDGDLGCEDRADVDDSGSLALLDALSLLEALFTDGDPPAYPYPDAGADLTEDELESCE